ncbi:site-specific integrase [Streptomyces sp. DH37]|uniref:tyrosine-type recombinase/integrase n=1 Tax=Streptomyces sp. DH37 TaxID=3040122 RepID=UPI0024417855|nr:site-specific integrase [Streptomyces sp. DH37]MDG9701730.1 site-specific integrase [Streptomyces sp. DH37]
MPGYIEDRWFTKDKKPTARHGKGMRYKVTGIPGVRARSFPDGKLTAARAWKAKAEHEAQIGEFVDPRLGQLSLRDYVEGHWWPAKTGDPATLLTIRSRLDHITALLGAQPLNAIRVPQLRLFLKQMESRVGPSTTHEVWGYLSAVLQAAVEDERIRKNPCRAKTITLPKIPDRKVQPWSKERIRAVREALPERFRAMVDVGVGCGLRQGEVFGLAVEDIDEAAEVLHVRRQVKKVGSKLVYALPKGGKTRIVPAPPYLLKTLKEHMDAHPPREVTLPWGDPADPTTEKEERERAPRTHALIFLAAQGGACRRDVWNGRYWKPALAAAGVIGEAVQVRQGPRRRAVRKYEAAREDGFHVLRHTFASVQLHAREPVVAVSKWLGHADAAITLRVYAHMMPEADGRGRRAMQEWFEADS